MLKLDALRNLILKACPRLQASPGQVIVLAEDGRVQATGTDALSFELHYTACVWVLGLDEHPDALIVPMLAWHRMQQPEHYAQGQPGDAFAFEIQPLDGTEGIDLHARLRMSERVIVQQDAATGQVTAAHHAPEPGPIGFADKPERWIVELRHPDGTRQRLAEFDGPALPKARAYLQSLGIRQ